MEIWADRDPVSVLRHRSSACRPCDHAGREGCKHRRETATSCGFQGQAEAYLAHDRASSKRWRVRCGATFVRALRSTFVLSTHGTLLDDGNKVHMILLLQVHNTPLHGSTFVPRKTFPVAFVSSPWSGELATFACDNDSRQTYRINCLEITCQTTCRIEVESSGYKPWISADMH